jgi:hypothetical protein
MKTLLAQSDKLSNSSYQIGVLNNYNEKIRFLPRFEEKLDEIGLFPLKPKGIKIFQMNLGYVCDTTYRSMIMPSPMPEAEVV